MPASHLWAKNNNPGNTRDAETVESYHAVVDAKIRCMTAVLKIAEKHGWGSTKMPARLWLSSKVLRRALKTPWIALQRPSVPSDGNRFGMIRYGSPAETLLQYLTIGIPATHFTKAQQTVNAN
ncbi:hypothetical protein VTI28DRAFT_6247 [Corynascus sepedonium]